MNLESQVCSFELAKRLKELGVKQDSLCYWNSIDTPWYLIVFYDEVSECSADFIISAFTATELAEMLPYKIEDCPIIIDRPFSNMWGVLYRPIGSKIIDMVKGYFLLTSDENLANALAKMLIYLLENGLVKND
jgi:hypothetical protein